MCLFHDYWVTLSNSRAWFRQTTWVVLRHLISTQEAKPQNQIINKSFRQSCTIFGEFLLAFSNYLETLLTCLYVFSNFPNYQILTTDLCDLDPLICPELNLPTWLVPTKATLGLPPAPPPPSLRSWRREYLLSLHENSPVNDKRRNIAGSSRGWYCSYDEWQNKGAILEARESEGTFTVAVSPKLPLMFL